MPERMPRPEGIATVLSMTSLICMSWPERMPRPEGIATDCQNFDSEDGTRRNECPDQRGLRHKICRLPAHVPVTQPERMPRPEGIATMIPALFDVTFAVSRNECPDQRGLRRQSLLYYWRTYQGPERMPRPEGIATKQRNGLVYFYAWPERMPRPEGIATGMAFTRRTSATGTAGTNAPTRGDCDRANSRLNFISGIAGTNAPTRGDCDRAFGWWFYSP